MPEQEDSCTIPDLAEAGADEGLNAMDDISTQAAVVYLLAKTIQSLGPGAPDYTDICALAKSLQQYDGLPDYALNAAHLMAWEEISENTTGIEPDWDEVKEAVRCAHCCDITAKSMKNAMSFLLCRLSTLLNPV